MDWPLAFLIVSLAVTLLGFLWGIIKVFKKPPEDKSWVKPLKELKQEIDEDDDKCQKNIKSKIKTIEKKLIEHSNDIHDLQKDKEVITNTLEEMKGKMDKVSDKCDAILDKVIESLKKD